MKKGRKMELMFFIFAMAVSVWAGWMYFDKSMTQAEEINDRLGNIEKDLLRVQDVQEDVDNRIMVIEDSTKNPPVLNVVMKEPVKVLVRTKPLTPLKPLPAQTPTPPIPGNIPKIKKQIKDLSQ